VPLPETIDIKYTEEEAEYLSMRPVVRQTFRAPELVDMIVRVAGKDLPRVQQILRSGTIVFHSFRYWWSAFEPDVVALREILASYPGADPARVFRPQDCSEVILESSGAPPRHALRVTRAAGSARGLLRSLLHRPSFWDSLMNIPGPQGPQYREYSYALSGDIYEVPLGKDEIARLANAAGRAARSLRSDLSSLLASSPSISLALFVCPRRT
jgi:hypothetical protein